MKPPPRRLIEGAAAILVIDGHDLRSAAAGPVLQAARERGVPLVFSDALAFARLGQDEPPRAHEYRVPRPRHSAFFGTRLDLLLRELDVQTLILLGGETSVAVHYTFVDAHQHDYFCRTVEDCTTGASPQAREDALRAMEYMQTGARRLSSEVIAALRSP